MSTPTPTPALVEVPASLVVLQLPRSELAALINSTILEKIVPSVEETIFIFVKSDDSSSYLSPGYNATTSEDSDVYGYIAQLYEFVWDCCLSKNKLSVKCYISTDAIHHHHHHHLFNSYNNNEVNTAAGYAPSPPLFPQLTTWISQQAISRVYMDLSSAHCSTQIGTSEIAEVKATIATKSSPSSSSSSLPLPMVELIDSNTLHALSAMGDGNSANCKLIFFEDGYNGKRHDMPVYNQIAIGGTFDRLHNGHRKLLSFAISTCRQKLTIGVTGDIMLKGKANAAMIPTFEERRQVLKSCISILGPHMSDFNTVSNSNSNSSSNSNSNSSLNNSSCSTESVQSTVLLSASGSSSSSLLSSSSSSSSTQIKYNIVELSDPFGPTISDPDIQAIVVSSETITGAVKINNIRTERGMTPLDILVTRRGAAATLSSSFIRNKSS